MILTHLDLFSGIGGFALASRWAGLQTVQFVEIDKFCQKVLNKNFPGVPIHEDIKTFKSESIKPFLLTAGCPCQPASCAGKRRGKEDDRWLWDEAFRVLEESNPTWAIFENVAGLLSLEKGVVFDNLFAQLEAKGYEVWPVIIPACAVNAPHRRDRVWIVAHAGCIGQEKQEQQTAGCQQSNCEPADQYNYQFWDDPRFKSMRSTPSSDTQKSERKQSGRTRTGREGFTDGGEFAADSEHATITRHGQNGGGILSIAESVRPDNGNQWAEDWHSVALRTCVRNLDDGLPGKLAGRNRVAKLKALGNSIVPQVAYQIIRSIVEVEKSNDTSS